MKLLRTFVFFVILGLSSCSSLTKRTINSIESVREVKKQELVVEKKLNKNTSVYLDAALRVLKKENAVSPQTKLALRLLENAQEISGVPEHSSRLNVDLLTIADGTEVKKLEDLEKEHRASIREREKLEEQVQEIQKKIEEDALKLAIIHDKSWTQKIKDWMFEYLSIIAIIACLVIFGPKLIGFIWRKFFI